MPFLTVNYGYWEFWDSYEPINGFYGSSKIGFDGINKLILIADGITELNVKDDIYSVWKRWVQVPDRNNAAFLQAMSAVGGDPITPTEFLGSTFFLENGWRLQPAPGQYILSILGNLYTREVNGNPVIPTQGVSVSLVRSNLVDGRVAITEDDYRNIADQVWNEDREDHVESGSFGEGISSVRGSVFGDITGNLNGNVDGDVSGGIAGSVTGNVIGKVLGGIEGGLVGDVDGTILNGVQGGLTGDVTGDIIGGVQDSISGNLLGNVEGDVLTPTTITDSVWDEVLDSASHNVDNSAGKRMWTLQDYGGYEAGSVWVDTVNGTAGEVNDINGTVGLPSSNLTNAVTIADNNNLTQLFINKDSTIDLSTYGGSVNDYRFWGNKWNLSLGNKNVDSVIFENCKITGTATITTNKARFISSIIDGVTIGPTEFFKSYFVGNFTIGSAGLFLFEECFSSKENNFPVIIDFAAVGATEVILNGFDGQVQFNNMATGDIVRINGSGSISLDSSCTDGEISVAGDFTVTNNSSGGGVTVYDETRIDKSVITEAVWDELTSGHGGAGTFGDAVITTRGVSVGRWKIDVATNKMIMYDSDNVSIIAEFDLKDNNGDPSSSVVFERIRT